MNKEPDTQKNLHTLYETNAFMIDSDKWSQQTGILYIYIIDLQRKTTILIVYRNSFPCI